MATKKPTPKKPATAKAKPATKPAKAPAKAVKPPRKVTRHLATEGRCNQCGDVSDHLHMGV